MIRKWIFVITAALIIAGAGVIGCKSESKPETVSGKTTESADKIAEVSEKEKALDEFNKMASDAE